MFKKFEISEYKDLDNAGKIFPWTSNKRDTKVFRFACELHEDIDKATLQDALDITLDEFPIYRSTLRQGFFWYYLRRSNAPAVVHEESESPCSSIFDANRYNLLFTVTYYKKRINVEVYHALTDGTGALNFLRTLVYNYIIMKHKTDFKDGTPIFDYDASFTQKEEDSFKKYYEKSKKISNKNVQAYRIRGAQTPTARIKVIEGVMPAKDIIDKAHEYNSTVSVFLTSIFLCAINKNAATIQKKRPIVLTVPVNLRKHFRSESARNFFCTINVGYDFANNPDDLESVIEHIDKSFKEELTMEKLSSRMGGFIKMERNAFARMTPLPLKNIIMRIAGKMNERESTGAISNIGRVAMPDGFEKYIRVFDFFTSTSKLQICMCSYGENMIISFSSAFRSSDIQKDFFRILTDMGISVEISANQILHKGGLE